MYRWTLGVCRHSCAVGNSNSLVSDVLHADTQTAALTSLVTTHQFLPRWLCRSGPKVSASLAALAPRGRNATGAAAPVGARIYHTTATALEEVHHGNVWAWIQSVQGPSPTVWAPLVLSNPFHRSLSTWKPREKDAVLTVGELCKLVTDSAKGSTLSFLGTASTAVGSFPSGPPPLHQASKSPIWPTLVSTEALHGVSVFQLQPGAENSIIWTVKGRNKTLQGMNITMEDHHCIMFDETCDNLTVQDAKFEGGIIVCKGEGSKVTFKNTTLSRCALVVLEGSTASLQNSHCSAETERGSGIAILAQGPGSTVRVSDVLVKGGYQGIAIHGGAALEEDTSVTCEEETLTCIGQELIGIECKDSGSKLTLRSCEVRYVGHRWGPSYISPEGAGVYVHSGSKADLDSSRIDCCVVGVVAENAYMRARDCHMRLNTSAGFLFEGRRNDGRAINGVLSNCVSRENGVGVAVGHGASIFAEFVVAVECSGDGFYVSSGTGGSAIMHHCSAVQCKGSGVHADGTTDHDAVNISFGNLRGNGEGHWSASGMRVRRGARAVLEHVTSVGNRNAGFTCANESSRLTLMNCTSDDDDVPYMQWLGGEITLHNCNPDQQAAEYET